MPGDRQGDTANDARCPVRTYYRDRFRGPRRRLLDLGIWRALGLAIASKKTTQSERSSNTPGNSLPARPKGTHRKPGQDYRRKTSVLNPRATRRRRNGPPAAQSWTGRGVATSIPPRLGPSAISRLDRRRYEKKSLTGVEKVGSAKQSARIRSARRPTQRSALITLDKSSHPLACFRSRNYFPDCCDLFYARARFTVDRPQQRCWPLPTCIK